MQTIHKKVLVTHSAEKMFHLVDQVEDYPRFLPWCPSTELVKRTETETIGTLCLDYLHVKQKFTTRNHNVFPSKIDMTLVEGPFKSLEGGWEFTALGEEGCRVEFLLRYEFSSRLLEKILGPVLNRIYEQLIDAFIQEADRLEQLASV